MQLPPGHKEKAADVADRLMRITEQMSDNEGSLRGTRHRKFFGQNILKKMEKRKEEDDFIPAIDQSHISNIKQDKFNSHRLEKSSKNVSFMDTSHISSVHCLKSLAPLQ